MPSVPVRDGPELTRRTEVWPLLPGSPSVRGHCPPCSGELTFRLQSPTLPLQSLTTSVWHQPCVDNVPSFERHELKPSSEGDPVGAFSHIHVPSAFLSHVLLYLSHQQWVKHRPGPRSARHLKIDGSFRVTVKRHKGHIFSLSLPSPLPLSGSKEQQAAGRLLIDSTTERGELLMGRR